MMSRIFLLLMFGISSLSFAETSVWKVSKGERELFIGGTIHLLRQSDFPLPEEFDKAYGKSDVLVFETDMGKVQGPEFQQMLMQRMLYTDSEGLKGELRPDVYHELEKYLQSRGMNITLVNQFKPGMLVMMMSVIEMQRIGMTAEGVDQHFYGKAKNEGKRVGQFETVEQQLELIANMGKGQENEMVLNTIQEMKQIETMLSELRSAWRNGKQNQIEKIALMPMKDEFPGVYKSIVVDRNNAWLPHIEQLMATPEVEFVLAGVLHMVGDDGILNQLRERGYQIQAY